MVMRQLADQDVAMFAPGAPLTSDFKIPLQTARSDIEKIFGASVQELRNWSPRPAAVPSSPLPIQVVDFFCGSGGMSLGFAALGRATSSLRVVGGCDIDAIAAKTFEANYSVPCQVADVREVAKSEKSIERFFAGYPDFSPTRETILIGCAPCQGFSSHRKKSWDEPDARNSLPAQFAKIAATIRPACIVMENVPEMLSTRYWAEFDAARRTLQRAGYIVKQSIYNAAGFGVPQERFRAIVVAMRRNFLLPSPFITDYSEYRTVRHAIGHLPVVEAGEKTHANSLHVSASHKSTTIDTIKAVPPNGGSRPNGIGPACLDKIKGFSDVYGRLYWDRPAITITHYARNPASGRFVHPEQHRGLTMRECAELQSFPPGFQFVGRPDDIYRQIGEAVPPLLSLGIASQVFVELQSPEPTIDELECGVQSIESPVSSSYSSVIAGIKLGRKKANV